MLMAHHDPPKQSAEKRMENLKRAQEIRLWRADLKRRLNAREVTVAQVLRADDDRLHTMKVVELVAAQHGWGPTRVNRFMAKAQISHSKSIAGLSERQRKEVLSLCSR